MAWPRHKNRHLAQYIALVGCCLFFAFAFRQTVPKVGLINDEAVEMLQSQDLSTEKFSYFAPNYHGGSADIIESLVSYMNAVIRNTFGDNLVYIHLFYGVCFCLASSCFFLLLKKAYQNSEIAAWGTLFFSGSSYAMFYNRILTRNGISLLWSSLLLLIIWNVCRDSRRISRWTLLLGFPCVLTCALWTYTSFKFVAAAVYMALGFHWLCSGKRRVNKTQRGFYLAGSFLGSGLLFSGLLFLGGSSLSSFLFRGSYVLRGEFRLVFKQYIVHLIRSLVLPVFHHAKRDFLIDVTHTAYDRQMLSWLLIPFFLIGLWRVLTTWRKEFRFHHVVCMVWILATIPLAAGGPSLKHHFALYPFVLVLAVHGIEMVYHRSEQYCNKRTRTTLLLCFCLCVVCGEIWHIAWKIPTNGLLVLDTRLPMAFSSKALEVAETLPKVYIVESYGRDATRYYTRSNPRIRYIWNQETLSAEMLADFKNQEPFGLVIQGRDAPVFLAKNKRLLLCFDKKTERVDAWDITSFLMPENPRCQIFNE